ncbi:MAG TPA: flagellar hook-basal body complex protein [Acidobacteriaceae bacterium]|nr:flagellar hook-basal body complex protein [Acidobacteriaceae bacterium]
MSSFSIPLTGLEASSKALNTIANNLSNMNTTAFKSQDVTFSDLFYQQIGSNGAGDPLQVGAGTQVDATETDFSQGSINETGNATDVALNGNGFFVVENGNELEYTRDGNFSLTSEGALTTQSGQQVMGYPVANGAVNTNAPLAPIQIPIGAVEQPQATTSMAMTANLDATAAAGTVVPAQVTIYDSLGVSHVATVDFTSQGGGVWNYNITLPDTLTPATSTATAGTPPVMTTADAYTFSQAGAAIGTVDPSTNLTISGATASGGTATISAPTVTAGESLTTYAGALTTALGNAGITGVTVTATGNTLSIAGTGFSTSGNVVQDPVSTNTTGSLTFDGNGNLTSPAGNLSGITFSGLADGATGLNMSWNLYGSNNQPTITQVASASAVSATTQNGYASGEYSGFTIDSSGVVSAKFSNGQTAPVGQLALASITNLQGLTISAGNNYQTTLASGAASIGVSGSAGLGSIQDEALEQSNVDISTQFSDLIVAQQAFEASSKAITTFDTVSQETINMIH